ncbi:hypothetical protein KUTeg_019287 [Tegillarca granosa]|uniref:Impact N-terminal domain-containing protein n=1 Tax=Tegillarca granosa TaxID=220873 RepID=A0ABQ9EGC3_TEGGR|nr:hypothetical protein KUTeg_019287 [Tegillarca granosa]
MSIDQKEREKLDGLKVETTNCVSDNGNKFLAIGTQVRCYTNIKNLYKKVASDASYASADHKIMVYRFQDEQGKLHEGYDDDNEHGCGRRLLKKLKDNNAINLAVVVVRYFSGKHIGPRRFTIMEELAMEASVKLNT